MFVNTLRYTGFAQSSILKPVFALALFLFFFLPLLCPALPLMYASVGGSTSFMLRTLMMWLCAICRLCSCSLANCACSCRGQWSSSSSQNSCPQSGHIQNLRYSSYMNSLPVLGQRSGSLSLAM
jgi:hypothetical protein